MIINSPIIPQLRLQKKQTLLAALLLTSLFSNAQNGYVQTANIKGQGNAMDTIIFKKTELSFGKTFPNHYKKDERVIQALKPYFVTDIAAPTNLSHPFYLAQEKEAREKLPEVKKRMIYLFNLGGTFREKMAEININNENDLNRVQIIYMPVYYLTPNIALFKNGENIAKYYNLSRGVLKYLLVKNQLPIGFFNYNYNNSLLKISFFPMHLNDFESYRQVSQLGKRPIGIFGITTNDPKRVGPPSCMFGYVEQEHLVYSYYEENIRAKVPFDSIVDPDPRYYKKYTLETIESFFLGNSSHSTIGSWLSKEVENLRDNPRKP